MSWPALATHPCLCLYSEIRRRMVPISGDERQRDPSPSETIGPFSPAARRSARARPSVGGPPAHRSRHRSGRTGRSSPRAPPLGTAPGKIVLDSRSKTAAKHSAGQIFGSQLTVGARVMIGLPSGRKTATFARSASAIQATGNGEGPQDRGKLCDLRPVGAAKHRPLPGWHQRGKGRSANVDDQIPQCGRRRRP
jgi:hypothetical protein